MSRNIRGRAFALRPKLLCAALFCPSFACAEAPTSYRHFDLPGQPLQTGLIELALQAEVTVVVNQKWLDGYNSTPIIGPHTPQQALQKLLAKAPLDFRYDDATNSFRIFPREDTQPAPEPGANVAAENNTRIEEVLVYAPSYPYRYNTLTNSQLQNGSVVYDNSRFHTVLPSQLIQDQMPLDISDLLKNGSGITPADGRSDSNDDFYMRGFPRHAVYVDGLRVENSTGGRFLPDNIEHAEVLKGPSTIRYGQGEPGGMINLVRKRPLDEPLTQLNFSVGNNGWEKFSADISNHLLDDKFRFRANLVNFQRAEAADINDLQQRLFAPVLQWQIDNQSLVDIGYEFQQTEQRAVDDFQVLIPVPEDNFPGANFDQMARYATPYFSADRHLFHINAIRFFPGDAEDSGWRLKGKFFLRDEERRGVRGTMDYLASDLLLKSEELQNLDMMLIPGSQIAIPVLYRNNPQNPYDPLLSLGTVRSIYDEESSETGMQSGVELEGSFSLLGLPNHIHLGADWHRQDIFQSYTIESRQPLSGQTWTESNFPSLVYLFNILFSPDRPTGNLEISEYRQVSDEFGIYLQNTLEISDKFSLTGGARLSRIETTREIFATDTEMSFKPVQKIRLQSGFHYQITDDIQLFGNYAQGLRSNQAKAILGDPIDEPELSDQWEAGIKGHFWNGRILAGFAAYRINKNNIYWIDEVSIKQFSWQEYGQRVYGIEMDFTAQISFRTQFMGSFSAQDNKLTYGPYRGNTPAATSPQTASLFLHHEPFKSLSLNIGGHYVGQRYANHSNDFSIYAFYTLEANLQYFTKLAGVPLAFKLSVKNLLDDEYYSDVVAGMRFNRGEGRQIVAGVTLDL